MELPSVLSEWSGYKTPKSKCPISKCQMPKKAQCNKTPDCNKKLNYPMPNITKTTKIR